MNRFVSFRVQFYRIKHARHSAHKNLAHPYKDPDALSPSEKLSTPLDLLLGSADDDDNDDGGSGGTPTPPSRWLSPGFARGAAGSSRGAGSSSDTRAVELSFSSAMPGTDGLFLATAAQDRGAGEGDTSLPCWR